MALTVPSLPFPTTARGEKKRPRPGEHPFRDIDIYFISLAAHHPHPPGEGIACLAEHRDRGRLEQAADNRGLEIIIRLHKKYPVFRFCRPLFRCCSIADLRSPSPLAFDGAVD
jgi:hypothetical protein